MSTFKLIVGIITNVAVFGGLLLLPAGTLNWWRTWLLLGVVFVGSVASTFSIFRVNKDLLEERFRPPVQKGQPLADKIVVLLFIATYLVWMVFIPLDVFRYNLFGKPQIYISSLGLVLFVTGWWIITLALRVNPFAAPVVKLQEERHQIVICSGVYCIVRHPMYAGCIPLLVGMALWLESFAAAWLAIVPILTLVLRILVEERFLRRELMGYEAYTERVRYRLIPFIW